MKKTSLIKIALLICLFTLTSCYRMPEEDEFSVVPSTNNPDLTREKPSGSFMPGMGF